MSAPNSIDPAQMNAIYALREAICDGDFKLAQSLLTSVTNEDWREELVLASFQAGGEDADESAKIDLWRAICSEWSDIIEAKPSRFLQEAIGFAPTSVFQDLIKRTEAKLSPLERHNAFFGCQGYASNDEKELLRKAAFDRAELDHNNSQRQQVSKPQSK